MTPKDKPEQLRSFRWFGPATMRGFGHRSRMKQLGYRQEDFVGKPVIAIVNTWSEINPCHAHLRERAEAVKRGVWQAGGFPVEIPAFSITETYMKPSPMLYRNLLAMDTEEALRSLPVDGAVLMGGCDKTTPGLLMGAISMNLPAVFLPAGPMLRGNWNGQPLGSGTDIWKFWAERCAGTITDQEWNGMEEGIARSPGFCMTMGTASTMASLAEALGMSLPGASSIPAPDSNHVRMAMNCGERIVQMVWEDLTPVDLLTMDAFENAITVDMAIGGSTNAIIHLVALAGRCGLKLELPAFDRISRRTPMLANIRPSGAFLMEDFYYAGGLRALMAQIEDLLHLDCRTVNGRTLGENIAGARLIQPDVIRPRGNPVAASGGTAVLYGNLAPDGAVIKPTAADPRLLRHTGPAIVFRNYQDLEARLDRDDLEVNEDSVLVLQNAGPLGGPGMPEWGMLPLPKKLLQKGVRDMVRISDARMSGTSYGTCVLHVSPESYSGGPLALVRDGDRISLDVESRKLELLVSGEELSRRRAEWTAPPPTAARGYLSLYAERVTQAHLGCDFDFLRDNPGSTDPEIH
ncbi:MAG TPA: L-arabinonate dehydratase [Bryobacteraceae bacterium]|jgi:dihydroxy-acid dehydratase|nr:L-arabinonate dehydratase [Bryobacteraceae bacterium]